MDIWQLGVLCFEVLSNRSYWPSHFTTQDVMTALTGGAPLPHENKHFLDQIGSQPSLNRMKDLLGTMLDRDPSRRPTAVEVKRSLDSEFENNTIGGATMTFQAANTVVI